MLFDLFFKQDPLPPAQEPKTSVPTSGYRMISNQRYYDMQMKIAELLDYVADLEAELEEYERNERQLWHDAYKTTAETWAAEYYDILKERDSYRSRLEAGQDFEAFLQQQGPKPVPFPTPQQDAKTGKFVKEPGTADKNIVAFQLRQKGESDEEIARVLGVKVSSVAMMVSRGKKAAGKIHASKRVGEGSNFHSTTLKDAIENGETGYDFSKAISY